MNHESYSENNKEDSDIKILEEAADDFDPEKAKLERQKAMGEISQTGAEKEKILLSGEVSKMLENGTIESEYLGIFYECRDSNTYGADKELPFSVWSACFHASLLDLDANAKQILLDAWEDLTEDTDENPDEYPDEKPIPRLDPVAYKNWQGIMKGFKELAINDNQEAVNEVISKIGEKGKFGEFLADYYDTFKEAPVLYDSLILEDKTKKQGVKRETSDSQIEAGKSSVRWFEELEQRCLNLNSKSHIDIDTVRALLTEYGDCLRNTKNPEISSAIMKRQRELAQFIEDLEGIERKINNLF